MLPRPFAQRTGSGRHFPLHLQPASLPFRAPTALAVPLVRLCYFQGSTCAGTPWPDDCNNGGLSGCWCERYDSVYVAPVQANQIVQQSLSGTFVIT